MSKSKKRRSRRRNALPKPRDPFWRLRRAYGEKRQPSAKSYRRKEKRRAERDAMRGEGDD